MVRASHLDGPHLVFCQQAKNSAVLLHGLPKKRCPVNSCPASKATKAPKMKDHARRTYRKPFYKSQQAVLVAQAWMESSGTALDIPTDISRTREIKWRRLQPRRTPAFLHPSQKPADTGGVEGHCQFQRPWDPGRVPSRCRVVLAAASIHKQSFNLGERLPGPATCYDRVCREQFQCTETAETLFMAEGTVLQHGATLLPLKLPQV